MFSEAKCLQNCALNVETHAGINQKHTKRRVCRIGEVQHHPELVNDFESTRRRSGPRLDSRSDMMSPLGTGIKAAWRWRQREQQFMWISCSSVGGGRGRERSADGRPTGMDCSFSQQHRILQLPRSFVLIFFVKQCNLDRVFLPVSWKDASISRLVDAMIRKH
jgi:hypothetical protein